MGGSIHWHKPAKRFYIQVYWGKPAKAIKIWRHPKSNEPFFDRRAAAKQLSIIRGEIDDKVFDPRYWKPDSPIMLAKYAEDWLDAKKVTPKTLAGYRTAVVKYIIPYFVGVDIRHIRAKQIRLFKEHLETILETKGVYNTVGVLKTMFRDAWRDEDIQRVPPFPVLSQGDIGRPDSLSIAEQDQQLTEIPARHRPIFAFGMEFGLRVGEVRAIQKDCLTDAHVTIKRAFSDNRLKGTKTGLQREYELTDYAKEVLSQVEPHLSPFIFVREDGKPYTNKDLNKFWAEASKVTGIRIKLYNAMRHSLGCQLVDQGHDLDLVRQQLGHTDIRTTRRYAIRSDQTLTSALEGRRPKVVPIHRKGSHPLNNH